MDYGPILRMTESSSLIENGLNLSLKNFQRLSGAEGESVLVENRIYRSHFQVCNLSGAERQLFRKSHSQAIFKDIHKSISWSTKKRQLTGNNIIRPRWFVSH